MLFASSQGAIERVVGLGGFMPAEIGVHGVVLDARPFFGALPFFQHPSGGAEQGVRGRLMEDEAGCTVVGDAVFAGINDGIGKAARRPHQRQGTVFEAVELGEAAGFEAAWHKDDVATGNHLVRERFVVGDAHADFFRMTPGEVTEGSF